MLLISRPEPCYENWEEMIPGEKQAFCKLCARKVIDFTAMNDKEIRNYLLEKSHQKVCGRFRNEQVAEKVNPLTLLSDAVPFWKKFLAIVVIVFGSLLMSCKKKLKNNSGIVPASSLPETRNTVMGYIMPGDSLDIVGDQGLFKQPGKEDDESK